ncbi:MAG: acyl-CoA thioesterase [Luteibaculaceae bacterium]
MFTATHTLRIRYAHTDKMGYCYYSRYAEFFEEARVEALRTLGVSYKELEDQGFLLPVSEYTIKYLKPAYYDELIRIKTSILEKPGVRITFFYETFNENGELLNKAHTTLVFTNTNGKPVRAPQFFLEKLNF